MITLTRLNGPPFALNCDLIERAEATPDTVLTLVDGTKYVVVESVEEVIRRICEFRASLVALAQHLEVEVRRGPALHVVPDVDHADHQEA
ncbi:MAG: flagellar FlbD family protein [Acidimicrobiia bacterium]|nr:flagellar FlbD family protein [Acidimicrobiia bacterium]